MAYFWVTNDQGIQDWLDRVSTIRIGDNFESVHAQNIENDIVAIVVKFLEPGWNITVASVVPPSLKAVAEQLTAAQIGMQRQGAVLGGGMADWTDDYRNQGWAVLSRLILTQPDVTLTGITKKANLPLVKRLLYSKLRERAVIANV